MAPASNSAPPRLDIDAVRVEHPLVWVNDMNTSIEPAAAKILLIVEDQALLAMGLKDQLEDGGYRVLTLADRHQEAIGIAQAIKPDLALVNIGHSRQR